MNIDLSEPSMYAYIKDTPRALRHMMDNYTEFTDGFCELLQQKAIQRIYFVGSGTSYNASIYGATLFNRFANIETTALFPTRFFIDEIVHTNFSPEQILVVGISQSGTSISTIDVLTRAKAAGFSTLALTDVLDSEITTVAKHSLRLMTGKEEVHVETRGYQASLLELYLLAIHAGCANGHLSQETFITMLSDAQDLANSFDQFILEADAWYDQHTEELMSIQRGFICSYGINACNAEEGELKLNETYHRPVRGYELEEMIHGPHYALDENNFSFFLAPDKEGLNRTKEFLSWYEKNNITEHVFLITHKKYSGIYEDKALCFTKEVPEFLSPLTLIIPLHIMACRNCINAGIDTRYRPKNRTSFAHLR